MAALFSRNSLLLACALLLSSWAVVQAGILYGAHRVPMGAGLLESARVTGHDLFRFDSLYYLSIAENGYTYNGDPNSSPNLVFAPMFPLLVRGLSLIVPGDPPLAGLVLNKILFFFALLFLLDYLTGLVGQRRAFWSLFALVTAAGAYSFHAFYSESTMLFFLSLALVSYQRRWRVTLALSALALGASRLTAGPIALGFALIFVRAAWLNRKTPNHVRRDLLCAALSVSGVAAYLAFIACKFGNPFVLFPEIQAASWGLFHPPTDPVKLATLAYFFEYWRGVFMRDFTLADVRILNLVWTSLGFVSLVYLFMAWRRSLFAFVFAIYFVFIYFSNMSSAFLISAHRFFALMVPLFLMFTALHEWIARKSSPAVARTVSVALLLINIGFGIYHAGQFNQGTWFFF